MYYITYLILNFGDTQVKKAFETMNSLLKKKCWKTVTIIKDI